MDTQLDRLWPGGPFYRQYEGVFPLSSDTAWLGAFVRLGRAKTACDLGCGGGALSLQLLGRKPALRMSALDILPEAAEATKYNAALNGYALEVRCGDLRDWRQFFPPGSFDLVVSNPPYWKQSAPAAGGNPFQNVQCAMYHDAAPRKQDRGAAFCRPEEAVTALQSEYCSFWRRI